MEPHTNIDGPIRVLMVDDNASTRRAIEIIVEDEEDICLCGEAEAIAPALEQCEALQPDLALVDLSLKGENGLELVQSIRSRFPAIRVVVFSLHDEKHYIDLARGAGAHGYAVKSGGPEELLTAIRAALSCDTPPDLPGQP